MKPSDSKPISSKPGSSKPGNSEARGGDLRHDERSLPRTGQVPSGGLKLNDHELASLLGEIIYAVRSDVPVVGTLQRLAKDRVGRLGRASKKIAEHLETGGSLSDAILLIKSPSAKIVAATVSPVDQAGHPNRLGAINADLLGLLASRIRARYDAARVSRLMWFYPLALIVIAYAVVLLVVVPLVGDYRFHVTDQPLGIHWPDWLIQGSDWFSTFPWVAPVLFLGFLVLGCFLAGRRPMFGLSVRKSLFCHALADQLGQGVPETDAISVASSLSSYPVNGQDPAGSLTLSDPSIKQLLDKVGGIIETDGIPEDVALGEEFTRVRIASCVAQFRYLGNQYQFAARRDQRTWSIVIPQIATVVFGLVFMTGYVWFVLGPIYREVAHW